MDFIIDEQQYDLNNQRGPTHYLIIINYYLFQ